ncbi:hypothetical protein Daura_45705 [Dactylosporangium aurantiacum]|uniref:Lipoprotein n=1 Tax=Dactylosporangium aurantiacum TaxID=35754 RepID=A0A9Q9II01_9ACTN|nr:hypothetical protein [Dactylosporangium aurantiacum]MDG6108104.1 hypothetical protein [Dactylosporangium aurantiacum]UWZ53734.1 hypothetical protein Daura_45705 [Dactylosporangium aurantiacum]
MAIRTVLFLAAVASVLGGCAAASDDTAAPSAAPTLSPVPSQVSAVPAPSRPATVPPTASGPGASGPGAFGPGASGMSVSGEVVEGVEAGCLLLRTPGTLYLLVGGDRAALQVGKRVTVVGTPQPGLMSTCQQGTPFQVVSVRSG